MFVMLINIAFRHRLGKLAAGLLQVKEWCMYGVLSSKLNHTFVKRPSDPKSRHVDFTNVFNSETQQKPSVRLMYLYMLHLAAGADRLNPQERPATADADNWVPTKRKKRARTSVSEHPASSDDHDADDSDATTGGAADGPAHHTRSKGGTMAPKAKQATSSSGTMQPQQSQKEMAESAKILSRIPQVPRSSLFLAKAISFGQDCVVWRLPC